MLMSEKYLIALDVGGTKADAVLFKENGELYVGSILLKKIDIQ